MARIIVIGSVSVDEVVKLDQTLREGTHLTGSRHGVRLGGGAACTAVPLAYVGHEVTLIGAIGRDDAGAGLVAELAATGVDTSQIHFLDQQTTRSLILVDGRGERTIVNVFRTHDDNPPERLLGVDADCVYVRSRRLDLAPLLTAKAPNALIIAHVPPDLPYSRPAHVLVASASDVGPEILDDPLAAGRSIAGDLLEWMVVTRGPGGVIAYGRDVVFEVSSRSVTPIDTTGAGDTFAAGLAHALTSGADMRSALETAVAWGAEATLYESSVLPPEAANNLPR